MASSASSFDGLDCIEYPSPWISSVRKIKDVIKKRKGKIKQKSVSEEWSLALIFHTDNLPLSSVRTLQKGL